MNPEMNIDKKIGWKRGLLALSPIIVFVISYLAVSIIIGDFYKMPLSVAMIIASAWAVAIFRGHRLADRIDIFSKQAAQPNIMYMIWVFILAGAFSASAKSIGSIEATVNFTLSILPPEFLVAGLFLAACFISISIGTSVGTVIALAPLATGMATAGGGEVPLYVAAVLGGAFFGDNLSFISDTTIAATRSQGCDMIDKFKANIWIAVPAAVITFIIYVLTGSSSDIIIEPEFSYDPLLLLPYIMIIVLALCSVNVTIVLMCGIVTSLIIGLLEGFPVLDIFTAMGEGIDSMGNLIVITLLAAGMLGIIKAMGGVNYLLQCLTRHIKGSRGGQGIIVALVAIVNLCTANNTIAIITVGSIAKDISGRFGIDRRKAASLLDTGSCIVQCLIPYGAQALLAAKLAGISPVSAIPWLYYPAILAIIVLLSIIFNFPRRFRVNKA